MDDDAETVPAVKMRTITVPVVEQEDDDMEAMVGMITVEKSGKKGKKGGKADEGIDEADMAIFRDETSAYSKRNMDRRLEEGREAFRDIENNPIAVQGKRTAARRGEKRRKRRRVDEDVMDQHKDMEGLSVVEDESGEFVEESSGPSSSVISQEEHEEGWWDEEDDDPEAWMEEDDAPQRVPPEPRNDPDPNTEAMADLERLMNEMENNSSTEPIQRMDEANRAALRVNRVEEHPEESERSDIPDSEDQGGGQQHMSLMGQRHPFTVDTEGIQRGEHDRMVRFAEVYGDMRMYGIQPRHLMYMDTICHICRYLPDMRDLAVYNNLVREFVRIYYSGRLSSVHQTEYNMLIFWVTYLEGKRYGNVIIPSLTIKEVRRHRKKHMYDPVGKLNERADMMEAYSDMLMKMGVVEMGGRLTLNEKNANMGLAYQRESRMIRTLMFRMETDGRRNPTDQMSGFGIDRIMEGATYESVPGARTNPLQTIGI